MKKIRGESRQALTPHRQESNLMPFPAFLRQAMAIGVMDGGGCEEVPSSLPRKLIEKYWGEQWPEYLFVKSRRRNSNLTTPKGWGRAPHMADAHSPV
ncbi:hypothetical protein [Roseimicrobium sp. ORNL1]|uniref:hypothetical protein n=1 Tax=Roseimicrobium sp. ORNL1 TaxID=2711231 RepID=UPI0013E1667F|nr:hypothetical protein [Roseimicrobium sp. ORNL1]QIF04739.1 hypothetical protein G5S37_25565 [Roseimicrobium sp. ORNL1]